MKYYTLFRASKTSLKKPKQIFKKFDLLLHCTLVKVKDTLVDHSTNLEILYHRL